MKERNMRRFIIKKFLAMTFCIFLIVGIFTHPVKGSVSYVTSLSATCVNTFVCDEHTVGPEDPSDDSDNMSGPKTGDDNSLLWYASVIFISLIGVYATCKLGHKKFHIKNKEKEKRR